MKDLAHIAQLSFAQAKLLLANKSSKILLFLFLLLSIYTQYHQQKSQLEDHHLKQELAQKVRQDWENSPDKHPHRMAHYGYLLFHQRSAHSLFDAGLQAEFGNCIFLEAHQQNSHNFSHDGFNSHHGLFGSLDSAKLLQILLVLILIFMAYQSIAQHKDEQRLLFMLMQGLKAWHLLFINTLGLWLVALLMLSLVMLSQCFFMFEVEQIWDSRVLLIFYGLYALYFFVISGIIIGVSAFSKSSIYALYTLLSLWMLAYILVPKLTSQLMANVVPIDKKAQFQAKLEEKIMKLGDSHNPDDPLLKKVKDSVLAANHVQNVDELKFNFKAYMMSRGEALSSQVYGEQFALLNQKIDQQNQWQQYFKAFFPHTAIQQISMAYGHSDLANDRYYLEQTEAYRYYLAQYMNDLQLKLVSNKKLKDNAPSYKISQKYWATLKHFEAKNLGLMTIWQQQQSAFWALVAWAIFLFLLMRFKAEKLLNIQ